MIICPECGRKNLPSNLTCAKCFARLFQAKLRIIPESGEPQTVHLHQQKYKLGREADNQIVIDDPSVSRYHAEICSVDGRFSIMDHGSKNGSLLNGDPFKSRPLQHLDCIQLGTVLLYFFDENEAPGHADMMQTGGRVKDKGKITQELHLAKEVQRKILSSAQTDFEGLQVRSISQACGAIGGDYFDIISLPGGALAITIGDVCGKGVPAALLSSTVHAAIRSQLEYSTSPDQIIRNLNALLIKSTAESIFLTLFFGILDVNTGKLRYINAGHPPPVLIKRNHQIGELAASTFALGIMDTEENQERTVTFAPGDTLIMYTDGVIETKNSDRRIYGRKRLVECIQSVYSGGCHKEPTLDSVVEKIVREVAGYLDGTEHADDLTLLAIKRR